MTNSGLGTFRRCRRKWYLSEYRHLTRRPDSNDHGALALGTLVHKGLEHYYTLEGLDPDRTYAFLRQEYEKEYNFLEEQRATPEELKKFHQKHDLALTIITGYFQWLEETGADSDLKVVSVEKRLECDSPVEGVTLLGKLDLQVLRTRTDQLFVLDHKTTQGFDDVISWVNINTQPVMYRLLQRRLHSDKVLQGTIWNMLKKSKRTARATPPFYMRYEVYTSEGELEVFWHQLFGQIHEILRTIDRLNSGESHQSAAWPTPASDCKYTCPFYQVCGLMNDPRSDHEYVLNANYVEIDPLQRYQQETETTDSIDNGGNE